MKNDIETITVKQSGPWLEQTVDEWHDNEFNGSPVNKNNIHIEIRTTAVRKDISIYIDNYSGKYRRQTFITVSKRAFLHIADQIRKQDKTNSAPCAAVLIGHNFLDGKEFQLVDKQSRKNS